MSDYGHETGDREAIVGVEDHDRLVLSVERDGRDVRWQDSLTDDVVEKMLLPVASRLRCDLDERWTVFP